MWLALLAAGPLVNVEIIDSWFSLGNRIANSALDSDFLAITNPVISDAFAALRIGRLSDCDHTCQRFSC